MEDSTAETTGASVDKKIDSFVGDGLNHATGILSALWEIANDDSIIIRTPASSSSPVSRFHFCLLLRSIRECSLHQTMQISSPAHWTYVKTALIKSIRKGVFFDRKYWARHLKTGDVLKPVYFSSTIMGDKSQQLKERALKFWTRTC